MSCGKTDFGLRWDRHGKEYPPGHRVQCAHSRGVRDEELLHGVGRPDGHDFGFGQRRGRRVASSSRPRRLLRSRSQLLRPGAVVLCSGAKLLRPGADLLRSGPELLCSGLQQLRSGVRRWLRRLLELHRRWIRPGSSRRQRCSAARSWPRPDARSGEPEQRAAARSEPGQPAAAESALIRRQAEGSRLGLSRTADLITSARLSPRQPGVFAALTPARSRGARNPHQRLQH